MQSCDWLLVLRFSLVIGSLAADHSQHSVILYFNIYCDFYLYYFNLFFQSWISCHHTTADI